MHTDTDTVSVFCCHVMQKYVSVSLNWPLKLAAFKVAQSNWNNPATAMEKCPHSLTLFDSLGLVTRGQTTNKKAVTSSIIEPDTAVPLSCKAEPQIAGTKFCYAKPSLIRNPSSLNNSLFLLHFWWIRKCSQIWIKNEA